MSHFFIIKQIMRPSSYLDTIKTTEGMAYDRHFNWCSGSKVCYLGCVIVVCSVSYKTFVSWVKMTASTEPWCHVRPQGGSSGGSSSNKQRGWGDCSMCGWMQSQNNLLSASSGGAMWGEEWRAEQHWHWRCCLSFTLLLKLPAASLLDKLQVPPRSEEHVIQHHCLCVCACVFGSREEWG